MAEFLGRPFFSCKICRNPLALREDLLSKNYVMKSGRGYMFSTVKNIVMGSKEEKQLMTGTYAIAYAYCSNCGEELGWKYLKAPVDTQKFKEGRYVLELAKMAKEY